MRAQSSSSWAHGTPGDRVRAVAVTGALAVGATAGVLLAFRHAHERVPDDVALACAEAASLAPTAPLSAASKYERAHSLLHGGGGGDPLHVAELLTLWGTALHDGRALTRAADTFARAERLLAALRVDLSPSAALANDLPRKHALVHDRLAAVAEDAGAPHATRARHLAAALDALEGGGAAGHARMLAAAAAPGGVRARHAAADCAGIYFNRSALWLEGTGGSDVDVDRSGASTGPGPALTSGAVSLAADEVAESARTAAAHDALRALRLVEAARDGCAADAARALGTPPPSARRPSDGGAACARACDGGAGCRLVTDAHAALAAAAAAGPRAVAVGDALRRRRAALPPPVRDSAVAAGREWLHGAASAVFGAPAGTTAPPSRASGRARGARGAAATDLAAELALLGALADDAAAQLREALALPQVGALASREAGAASGATHGSLQ